MQLKHFLPGLVCAAWLAGCASNEAAPAAKAAPIPTLASALANANTLLKEGKTRDGADALQQATNTYPADKQAWLRLAQLKFDAGAYGAAIVNAGEVLERDPDDMQAHSITAVASLRVAVKSLADLAQKNHLNGSVRSEAQDLAKLLRARLGEPVIVRPPPLRQSATSKGNTIASDKPAGKGAKNQDDPFSNF